VLVKATQRAQSKAKDRLTLTITMMMHQNAWILLLATAVCFNGAYCLAPSSKHMSSTKQGTDASVSRRSALAIAGAIGLSLTLPKPKALAADTEDPKPRTHTIMEARSDLMESIRSNNSEKQVMSAIEKLLPFDPSQGRGATLANDLDGEWRLLWSAKADAFSPLLKLPKPLKPDSYQYLGTPAATEVGEGRVAQGLTGGILGPTQLWLSSGVTPSLQDPSVLDILPPFRFQVGGSYLSGTPKITIVEAGSDAEFRQANARTQEAQEAPKNAYQQLYVERNGKGSIRISTVASGDPVIVGAIFVHQKM
jgi:hypothetical protein